MCIYILVLCVCPYVRSRDSPSWLSLRFILMRTDLARPRRYHPGQNSTYIDYYRHVKYRYILPISNLSCKLLKIGLFVTLLNKLPINGIFNYSFFFPLPHFHKCVLPLCDEGIFKISARLCDFSFSNMKSVK